MPNSNLNSPFSQKILELVSDGFVRQDASAQIIEFNLAALNILGLTEDQLQGRTSLDPKWAAFRQDGTPFPGQEHPAIQALTTGQVVKGVIMGLRLPSDEKRWIRITAAAYNTETIASQTLPGVPATRQVICTFSDVTDLITAQEDHQFVLDTLEVGIWKFNPIDQSLHWDQSMYRLFDVEQRDFTGHYQAWESTLTPEAKSTAIHELQQALSGEKEFDTTFEIHTKSRGRRFIAGRGKVVRDSKGVAQMMYGINFDRTEEVMLEKEVEQERLKAIHNAKLASLGEMSAGVAHEINNPLAILSGSLVLLQKEVADPAKFSERIANMQRSIERMATIVKGLRKFSRISDGRSRKSCRLEALVQESVNLTETIAKRNGVVLQLDLETEGSILCDEIEIEQVLVNLLSNAFDAAKNVEVGNQKWVRMRLFADQDQLVLQIRDSGKGIQSSHREKIFQPFFTTKPVGEGTGLGLSISKGILDQHKASIQVLWQEPETCFELRFPKEKSNK